LIGGAPDEKMHDGTIYAPRLEKLLGKIGERYGTASFYSICAAFYHSQREYLKWLQFKEKAYRKLLNDPLLVESLSVFQSLVKSTIELTRAYYEARNLKSEPRVGGGEQLNVCPNWAYQAKMALKAVIGRTKVNYL
jgi:hypothetical protein